LKNSRSVEVAVPAYSSGFDVVALGVNEPVEFIVFVNLEMNLLD
jgi:hypothetical protein